MLPPDTYLHPDEPDPVLLDSEVLTIVQRFVPKARSVVAIDESGGEARAYAVDDDLILKVQRPHQVRLRTSLEKEAYFLNILANDPGIRVPRVLGYGRDRTSEYICMSRIPGVAASSIDLPGEARRDLLRDLGWTLRRIHSSQQKPLYDSGLFPGIRTGREFLDRVKFVLRTCVTVVSADPALWSLSIDPTDLAERVLASLPQTVDLVALHSNPGPEHTFVEPLTLCFSGLIDFGDAYFGHAGFDMRWPTFDDNLAILDGYQEEARVSSGFLATWNAAQVIADLTNITRRRERREQALARLQAVVDYAYL